MIEVWSRYSTIFKKQSYISPIQPTAATTLSRVVGPKALPVKAVGAERLNFSRNTIAGSVEAVTIARQFTAKTGTISEDSPLGLDKWLAAMWQVVNCKNGVSSYEVHRAIGITQKSAWFMDHRIRHALNMGTINRFSGQIEADETFIGGKARNMHKTRRRRVITGRGGKDKTAVMGILERGGKVRTKFVDNNKRKTLQAELREHVLASSAIFTDAPKSYEGLNEFQHEVIDHAVEYVGGECHTNGLENFWSLEARYQWDLHFR